MGEAHKDSVAPVGEEAKCPGLMLWSSLLYSHPIIHYYLLQGNLN